MTISYFLRKILHIEDNYSENFSRYFNIQRDHGKFTPFVRIPIYALLSWWIFRASKQNYTENLILNTYMSCGWIVVSFGDRIFDKFSPLSDETNAIINFILIFSYIFIFFYQYFRPLQANKIVLSARVTIMTFSILSTK
ncbi:hypothetical protein CMU25_17390 [Elizabethkingia anophelis]|nr:hypothetical protein [Elizabethkingia anophelis]MDV3842097.1 hypothetical protein [Elizabethkingia anophelis]